jgi:hypothetical protein
MPRSTIGFNNAPQLLRSLNRRITVSVHWLQVFVLLRGKFIDLKTTYNGCSAELYRRKKDTFARPSLLKVRCSDAGMSRNNLCPTLELKWSGSLDALVHVIIWYGYIGNFLHAFAKLQKSDNWLRHMSVCPHGTTRLPLDGFSWHLTFAYFSKICHANSSPLKSDKNTSTLRKYLGNIYGSMSLSKHILYSIILFWKSCRLCDNA